MPTQPRFAILLTALACAAAVAPTPSTAAPAKAAQANTSPFRELKWAELIPKGWDPSGGIKPGSVDAISDADPRAWSMMRRLREVWDNAPAVGALEGASVKIPGYVVPVEEKNGKMTEFLLVPYFGACIHTPPPPANQIIYVKPDQPVAGFHTMDTVWVTGDLHVSRQDSVGGASGYRIDAVSVSRYVGAPHY